MYVLVWQTPIFLNINAIARPPINGMAVPILCYSNINAMAGPTLCYFYVNTMGRAPTVLF